MKSHKILMCIILLALQVSCNTGRKGSTISMTTVNYEPVYKKDRRLENCSSGKTNSHGSYGAGMGESYASVSYRHEAIKAGKACQKNAGDNVK